MERNCMRSGFGAAALLSLVFPSCTVRGVADTAETVPERFYVVRNGSEPTLNEQASIVQEKVGELLSTMLARDARASAIKANEISPYLALLCANLSHAIGTSELSLSDTGSRDLVQRCKAAGAVYKLATAEFRADSSAIDPIGDARLRIELINLEARAGGVAAHLVDQNGDSWTSLSGTALNYAKSAVNADFERQIELRLGWLNERAEEVFGARLWTPFTLYWY